MQFFLPSGARPRLLYTPQGMMGQTQRSKLCKHSGWDGPVLSLHHLRQLLPCKKNSPAYQHNKGVNMHCEAIDYTTPANVLCSIEHDHPVTRTLLQPITMHCQLSLWIDTRWHIFSLSKDSEWKWHSISIQKAVLSLSRHSKWQDYYFSNLRVQKSPATARLSRINQALVYAERKQMHREW